MRAASLYEMSSARVQCLAVELTSTSQEATHLLTLGRQCLGGLLARRSISACEVSETSVEWTVKE